jgi:exocyst complex protein 7
VSALTKEAAEALPADPAYADGAVGFVGHVDQLCDAIEEAVARGDEAVRRVEEVVGFLAKPRPSAAVACGG